MLHQANFNPHRFEFRSMAVEIICGGGDSESGGGDADGEVDMFVSNVFKIFDANLDGLLDFEEFTLATCAKGDGASPKDKMEWLFENVYDKVRMRDN
jgi:hypothetical protein